MNCAMAWSAARTVLLAAAALALAPTARAAAVCGVTSSDGAAFGAYDVLSPTPTDTLALVRVRCESVDPGNPNISLTLAIGPGNTGSVNGRRMRQAGGTDTLGYGLFRDTGRSAVWGYTHGVDTLTQTVKVQNNRTAEATFTVYGRMPAQQDVAPGTYTDSVQVTLTP